MAALRADCMEPLLHHLVPTYREVGVIFPSPTARPCAQRRSTSPEGIMIMSEQVELPYRAARVRENGFPGDALHPGLSGLAPTLPTRLATGICTSEIGQKRS
jgi:hypothetical protein